MVRRCSIGALARPRGGGRHGGFPRQRGGAHTFLLTGLVALAAVALALVLPVAWAQSAHISGNRTQTGWVNFCAAGGSTNAYTCALAGIGSYRTGTRYTFVANAANTGAATFNVNNLGVKALKKLVGGITTDVIANDLRTGQVIDVLYDGLNMQVLSQVGNAASPTADFASNTATSVDSEVLLFSGTAGKTGKRATGTGLARLTSGVLSTVTAPTGAVTGTLQSGSLALAQNAIGSAACATPETITVSGLTSADVILASFNADVATVTGYTPATTGTLRVDVWPSTNTINVKVCNGTVNSITPGAVTLNWRVVR